MPYLDVIVLSVCAVFFYRAGRQERSWGWLWAALSVVLSGLVLWFTSWGLIGVFAAQAALFIGITLHRMRDAG